MCFHSSETTTIGPITAQGHKTFLLQKLWCTSLEFAIERWKEDIMVLLIFRLYSIKSDILRNFE